jgi:hypothetical protein
MPAPPTSSGGQNDNIVRGPILQKVDQACTGARRAEFLAALRDLARDLVDVLSEFASLTPSEQAYLRRYWFDPNWFSPDSVCWWQYYQPIAPIVRQGLIKAIELATEDDAGNPRSPVLPVYSYWLYTGDQLEMIITRSDQQVTLVWLTPRPPVNPPADFTADADIWVIRRDLPGERVERQVNDIIIARKLTSS